MRALILPASLLLAASGFSQDKIFRTDGEAIDDVKIVTEGIKEVTYEQGRNKGKKISAADVLRIEFGSKPKLVDQADTLADGGQFFPAINELEDFLSQDDPKENRKYPWGKAYAMFRIVQFNSIMNETDGVIAAADRVVEQAADSRYAPLALIAKAQAQFDGGKGKDSVKTLDQLQAMIDSHGLGGRWSLEREVRTVIYDTSLKGQARIDRLKGISSRAGSANPTVFNAAEVAIGEQHLSDKNIGEAMKVFKSVTRGGGADDRTMAAAFTGLGDCLFAQAEKNGNPPEDLKSASMAYLRVVVLYPSQFAYAPKAMLYAGRSLQLIGGPENGGRARKLYTTILRDFGNTRYAEEARSLRRTIGL